MASEEEQEAVRKGRSTMERSEAAYEADAAATAELSHTYIEHPPLRFDIAGASGVMYDEGTRLLLVSSPNKVFAWPVSQRSPPATPRVSFISEGPVLAARFSLDQQILAVQRTLQEVELVTRESGAWRQRCRQGADRILGFFWIDTPTCNLVFVTPVGLELYSVKLPGGNVRLVEFKRMNVVWYTYTHESRLALFAAGPQCRTLVGYQFTSTGLVKVPRFDVSLTKGGRCITPVLAPEDLHIAVMYGRLYGVVVDRGALQLRLYRFYRDAVIPGVSMAISSPHVAMSVVDNVLCVHQTDARVVLLFDPLSNSPHPIASPRPLTLRKPPSDQTASSSPAPSSSQPESSPSEAPTSTEEGVSENEATQRSEAAESSEEGGPTESGQLASSKTQVARPREGEVYGEGWVYVTPDMILDHANGVLWRLRLDLEGIAASCSDLCALLAFLQRRRCDPLLAKNLSLAVLRAIIAARSPLSSIAAAFDVTSLTYASAAKAAGASRSSPAGTVSQAPAGMDLRVLAFASMGAAPGLPVAAFAAARSLNWGAGSQPAGGRSLEGRARGGSTGCRERRGTTETPRDSGQGSREPNGTVSEREEAEGGGCKGERGETSQLARQEPRTSKKGGGSSAADAATNALAPAISPQEIGDQVVSEIEEEMAVDSTYLVAVMIELLSSLAAAELRAPSRLQLLLVQVLLREGRQQELWQLLHAQVIERSVDVARLLLAEGGGHRPLLQEALAMLRQLGAHRDYVESLLAQGHLLPALRYARRYQIDEFDWKACLDRVAATSDPQTLATLLRFCSDFVVAFRDSPTHLAFSALLDKKLEAGASKS